MKHLLYLVTLLSTCLPALGQQYQYVPTTAYPAMWQVVAVYPKDDSGNLTRKCTQVNYQFTMSAADSLYGGKYWKTVTMREHRFSYTTSLGNACQLPDTKPKVATSAEDFYTFVREDNMAIYDRNFTTTSLFDFNAAVGTKPSNSLMGYVTAIDTIVIDGGLRRRFHTSDTLYSGQVWTETFVEGIGSLTRGLVVVLVPDKAVLTCFESNGKIIYQDANYPCGAIFPMGTPTGMVEQGEELGVSVHPNPFTDQILISNSPTGTTTILYNSVGQRIAGAKAGVSILETSELPVGMYFLILKNNNGEVVHFQKLVKQ